MRIELDLPDWVDERRIIILAGIELVAEKVPWEEKWKVKETRCNMCGACCMNFTESIYREDLFPVIDGTCTFLEKEPGTIDKWRCTCTEKPFSCLHDPPNNLTECCITYSEQ